MPRSLLSCAVWCLGSGLLVATGLFTGWLPTRVDWFAPMGLSGPVAAAGGYAGSAVVLVAAALVVDAWRGPTWVRRAMVFFAALYGFAALRSAVFGSSGEGWEAFAAGWWLAWSPPWCWLVLAAGPVALLVLLIRARL